MKSNLIFAEKEGHRAFPVVSRLEKCYTFLSFQAAGGIRPAAAPFREAADNGTEGITETVRKWNGRGFLSWLIKNMVWLSGAAVGAAAFLCIYGVHVLNVTYTDWLLGGGDLTQHYLGWCFFRDSAWTFPVGLMDRMSWPYEVSVIFTDSVPLLAVFFKLFRGILPEQFQYFGLWGLMCFLLQGAFASLLIHHYVGKKAEAAVGSLLFILTPVLLSQMTVNMALGAHWLVLLCLWLGIMRERLKPVRTAVCWGAAGLLAAGVQLYFIPICGLILLSFFLTDLVKKKEIRRGAAAVGAFAACSVGMTALLGGFSHAHLADFTILGQAAFNLNGLFNPQGWSRVIETLPVRGDDAQEGLAFPGVGILLALTAGLIGWFGRIAFRLFVRRENPFPALAAGLRGGQGYPGTGSPYGRKGENAGAFLLLSVLCVMIALSSQISLGSDVLVSFSLPQWAVRLWGMVGNTGRFIWPVVYLVILGSVVFLEKSMPYQSMAAVLLVIFTVLQAADGKWQLMQRKVQFGTAYEYASPLDDEKWEEWAEDPDIGHMVFVSYLLEDEDLVSELSVYAVRNGMTVNDFCSACVTIRAEAAEDLLDALADVREDTLYIYLASDEAMCVSPDMDYTHVDGVIVGTAKKG